MRAGQSAWAASTVSAAASATETGTLAIALSQAASPGRTLAPPPGQQDEQRGSEVPGRDRVAEQGERGRHDGRFPAIRSRTARSASACPPSIAATKWLSTASVSPASAMASPISRALYSSRLATAVYR